MALTSRFEEALIYASHIHAAQVRKGSGAPYISHLLATAAIVLEYGGGEDEAIAALLHDAAEDQGGRDRLEDIRRRFGEPVAAIVEACTDTFESPKPPWRPRKEAYIARLPSEPPGARLVSAADKLSNVLSTIAAHRREGEAVWERFRGRREGTLWYFGALVDAFRAAGTDPLVEDLARAVATLQGLGR